LVIASAVWYGLEKKEPMLLAKYQEGGISQVLPTFDSDRASLKIVQSYFDMLQKKLSLETILTQQEL